MVGVANDQLRHMVSGAGSNTVSSAFRAFRLAMRWSTGAIRDFQIRRGLVVLLAFQSIRDITRHNALYQQALVRNPGRWSGPTRKRTAVTAVTLTPERDAAIGIALLNTHGDARNRGSHKRRSFWKIFGNFLDIHRPSNAA